MEKVVFIVLGFILSVQFSFAQPPINVPDNIGSGNCLDFDGVNDYVQTTFDIDNYIASGNPVSIECWVKTTTTDNNKSILSDSGPGPTTVVHYDNGIIRAKIWNTGWVYANTPINTGDWYHLAVVYNGSETVLYINGVQDASLSSGSPNGTHGDLIIGATRPTQNFFNGYVDDVRFWDRALTSTEIRDNICKKLNGSETGLIGFWNMNEGTGSAITDLTSNGNHGTLQ